jgi:hypothetical protein
MKNIDMKKRIYLAATFFAVAILAAPSMPMASTDPQVGASATQNDPAPLPPLSIASYDSLPSDDARTQAILDRIERFIASKKDPLEAQALRDYFFKEPAEGKGPRGMIAVVSEVSALKDLAKTDPKWNLNNVTIEWVLSDIVQTDVAPDLEKQKSAQQQPPAPS